MMAYDQLKSLSGDPRNVFTIHWARQSLNDNEGGRATPRIIAIMVRSLDESVTEIFAIHLEAERVGIVWEEIETYYDQLEEQMIRAFNDFINKYKSNIWVHWDSEDTHLGFEALKHRYRVLVDEQGMGYTEIPHNKRINLNSCLKRIYGRNYENHPQFENLCKSNNNGVLKSSFLTLQEEADCFRQLDFPIILESVKAKTDFLIEVVNKAVDKHLKVGNRNLMRKIGAFFTHPIMIAIAWIVGILGFILSIVK